MFLIYHLLKLKYQQNSYKVTNLLVRICLWNFLRAFYVPYILLQIGQRKIKAIPVDSILLVLCVFFLSFFPIGMGSNPGAFIYGLFKHRVR
jgi:hypothetical protein